MEFKWNGPYQFFPCERSCPECQALLLTQVHFDWSFLRGILHDFGVTAQCMSCNVRYRAFGKVTFKRLSVVVGSLCFAGLVLLILAVWFLFSSWMMRILGLLALCFMLWKLPGFILSVAERLWWKEARLEKILIYQDSNVM